MTKTSCFQFEGVAQPVSLTGCAALLGVLPHVLQNWRIAPAEAGAAPGAVSLFVARNKDKWRCTSHVTGEDVAFRDPVAAACWLTANLMRARTLENPDLLCLHAASVEIGGGLVVMPSRFRAGKSVLTATFAAMGLRVFGDDVLPIDPLTGEGVAAGIAPRLRLPAPETLAPETRAFIADRKGPEGQRYLYLDLPHSLMAPKGTTLPIRGFALLDREEDGPARLTRAPEGDALKQVIWQNFGREGPADAILDRLAGIVARAPCVRLRYARAEDGARALIDAFTAPSLDQIPEEPYQLDVERDSERAAADLSPDDLLIRTDGCALRARAGRQFLIGAEGLTIMAMDDLGAALWRLLEAPTTYSDLLDLVSAAFPDQEGPQVDADLKALIGAFLRNQVAEIRA